MPDVVSLPLKSVSLAGPVWKRCSVHLWGAWIAPKPSPSFAFSSGLLHLREPTPRRDCMWLPAPRGRGPTTGGRAETANTGMLQPGHREVEAQEDTRRVGESHRPF
jgi:hypothetical protein